MKRALALLTALLLLCGTAAASAKVYGHFVSEEDGTYIIILSEPINQTLAGVFIGSSTFRNHLERDEREDGSIRLFTTIDQSDIYIELLMRYEGDDKQTALATGFIKRFDNDGALIPEQSVPDIKDVRFVRQEELKITELGGTTWFRSGYVISGRDRTYPFDGSVIEFSDAGDNSGRIPDNVERTYPFTYQVGDDSLSMLIEAGGKVTEATARIDSNVLIVTIENSILYFLPPSVF